MELGRIARRLGRWIRWGWRFATSVVGLAVERLGFGDDVDPHTLVTFRAVVDAVLPETPVLADELGEEHVPGGLAIELEEFVVSYVDDGFQLGLPYLGPQGNIPLADPVAHVLDMAALKLLDRGDNAVPSRADRALSLLGPDDPPPERVQDAVGPFSKLSRRDRLRAIGLLDELEVEFTPAEDDLFEMDAGLVGQLVVGFVEMIYYSEWQGYEEYHRPPSERDHPNDPAAVQSWRQTGFPGFSDGYAALRGYVGTDGSPLGAGETWTSIDGTSGVRIVHESGSFAENGYDTSDYAEPFPVASG